MNNVEVKFELDMGIIIKKNSVKFGNLGLKKANKVAGGVTGKKLDFLGELSDNKRAKVFV